MMVQCFSTVSSAAVKACLSVCGDRIVLQHASAALLVSSVTTVCVLPVLYTALSVRHVRQAALSV